MGDLDPVVGEANGGCSNKGEHHENTAATERQALRQHMRSDVTGHGGEHDGDSTHRRCALLLHMALRAIGADRLADLS